MKQTMFAYSNDHKHRKALECLTRKVNSIELQMQSLAFNICNEEISGIKIENFCDTMIPALTIAKREYKNLQEERLSIINTINFLMGQDFDDQNNE